MNKLQFRDRSPNRSAKSVAKSSAFKKDTKKTMSGDDYDDDRYEVISLGEEFGQSSNTKKSPEPTLDDYMEKVLNKKQELMDEKMETRTKIYDTALQFTNLLIKCAYDRHTLFKTYIRARKGRPCISHFRAVGKETFCCLVPLKRPVRLGTFKVLYRNPRDFPNHRVIVSLVDAMSNLERQQMASEWGHCVDPSGIVCSDLTLMWFNDGLELTCKLLMKNESENKFNFKDLSYTTNNDCTLSINISTSDGDTEPMSINIVPCLVLEEIPRQLKIPPLFPSRRPLHELNTKFKQLLTNELESGKEWLYLKANIDSFDGQKTRDTFSWELYTVLLEGLALSFVRENNKDLGEEDLRFVLDRIIDNSEYLDCVPGRIINNSILYLNKLLTGKPKFKDGLFLELLKMILTAIRNKKLSSFFLPKLNLLSDVDSEQFENAQQELEQIINDLESDPSLLMRYTGLDKCTGSDKEDDEEDEPEEEGEKDDNQGLKSNEESD